MENRKKGRFYIDRPRCPENIPDQEMRVRAEANVHRAGKRRLDTNNAMVADLGYMESNQKKNKRSVGSHIQADARKHFNEMKTGQ